MWSGGGLIPVISGSHLLSSLFLLPPSTDQAPASALLPEKPPDGEDHGRLEPFEPPAQTVGVETLETKACLRSTVAPRRLNRRHRLQTGVQTLRSRLRGLTARDHRCPEEEKHPPFSSVIGTRGSEQAEEADEREGAAGIRQWSVSMQEEEGQVQWEEEEVDIQDWSLLTCSSASITSGVFTSHYSGTTSTY
ncbi:unnamed protein product [Pleuronectes platessa]|uniref:Uncharacterized protein n=1 Tax=Pleuronectes platessa TaxID=8262 RepID=A0A9N7YFV0_PLEPL|nr:unnamed protein product [Pleuronectes platessa]